MVVVGVRTKTHGTSFSRTPCGGRTNLCGTSNILDGVNYTHVLCNIHFEMLGWCGLPGAVGEVDEHLPFDQKSPIKTHPPINSKNTISSAAAPAAACLPA